MGKTTALMLAAALMTARTLDAQTVKVVVAPPPVALSGLTAFLEAPSASLTPPANPRVKSEGADPPGLPYW